MCLGIGFWVHLFWNSLGFLHLDVCFLAQIREIFIHYFFKYVFCPFFSLFSFWDPSYNLNVVLLDVVS